MIEVAVAILVRDGAVWTRRRRGTGHLDGFLEFPGGKLEPGESPLAALLREVREETGAALSEDLPRPLCTESFTYPDRRVLIHFFICGADDAEPDGEGVWKPISELKESEFPPANRTAIRKLREIQRRAETFPLDP